MVAEDIIHDRVLCLWLRIYSLHYIHYNQLRSSLECRNLQYDSIQIYQSKISLGVQVSGGSLIKQYYHHRKK